MGKRSPWYTIHENENWCSCYGKQYGASSKHLKYNTVLYSNPTLGYRPEGIEIRISKRSLHSHVPCRITYNSHNLNAILEKAMAPHSNTLAWKIPWMEEPGRLQSMGSLRVGRDWATSVSLFTFMHWRRKWQPTPVFLPGESQGWGSLVGCRLWGCTESDTTEAT